MNLETLRRKRARRLGVKASAHTGQRRIFFVLDRATRKFHGDIGLWMQYADYARKQKAHKKVSQILTSLLRLHPTKPELWIYAASYAIEFQGDMTEARSYLQRGLRFCKRSKELWLEYAKLEMIYIAKIAARRRILGLDGGRQTLEQASNIDDPDADLIALPAITAEDINPNLQTHDPIDQTALGIETRSADFPRALDCALDRLNSSIDTIPVFNGTKKRSHSLLSFVRKIVDWLVLYLEIDDMDPDIQLVLSIMAKRILDRYQRALQDGGGDEDKEVAWIAQTSKCKILKSVTPSVVLSSLQLWPLNPTLVALRDSVQTSLLQSQ